MVVMLVGGDNGAQDSNILGLNILKLFEDEEKLEIDDSMIQ